MLSKKKKLIFFFKWKVMYTTDVVKMGSWIECVEKNYGVAILLHNKRKKTD